MTPGPAVAQQLGPMGINMGKVISDVNEATKDFKGINVPVVLDVDAATKDFKITVLSPPTSELIKKEMGIEKASGERNKIIVGNMGIENIIAVSKTKHEHMLSRSFIATVKSVIGTAMALGFLVESKDPKEVMEEIEEGKYKEIIEQKKSELAPEKKKELDDYFNSVSKKQQAELKKEEEEKAAEEEAKAAAAVTEGKQTAEAATAPEPEAAK